MADIIVTSETGSTAIIQPGSPTNFIISGAYQGDQGDQGNTGPGVPDGGLVGQFVVKTGAANQQTGWGYPPAGNIVQNAVAQAAHGFSLGQAIRYTTGGWYLSLANTRENSEVLGIVVATPDADHFVVGLFGYVEGVFNGLTPGVIYFLSDTYAGQLTSVEPTNPLSYSYPLILADSNTGGYIIKQRAIRVGL